MYSTTRMAVYENSGKVNTLASCTNAVCLRRDFPNISLAAEEIKAMTHRGMELFTYTFILQMYFNKALVMTVYLLCTFLMPSAAGRSCRAANTHSAMLCEKAMSCSTRLGLRA